jgi:hypothetical protein
MAIRPVPLTFEEGDKAKAAGSPKSSKQTPQPTVPSKMLRWGANNASARSPEKKGQKHQETTPKSRRTERFYRRKTKTKRTTTKEIPEDQFSKQALSATVAFQPIAVYGFTSDPETTPRPFHLSSQHYSEFYPPHEFVFFSPPLLPYVTGSPCRCRLQEITTPVT